MHRNEISPWAHIDVKTLNIMLHFNKATKSLQASIGDFGMAETGEQICMHPIGGSFVTSLFFSKACFFCKEKHLN